MDGIINFEELANLKPGIEDAIKLIKLFVTESDKLLGKFGDLSERNFKRFNSNLKGIEQISNGINKLNVTTKAGQKSVKDYGKQFENLEKEQKDLIKANKSLIDTEVLLQNSRKELIDESKRLQKIYDDTVTSQNKNSDAAIALASDIRKLKSTAFDLGQETKRLNGEFDTVEGSYKSLQQANKILNKELKNLPLGLKKGTQAFAEAEARAEELKKEILENKDALKEFDSSLGDNFRNVGNYKESIKEALEETGAFGIAQEKLNEVLGPSAQLLALLTKRTRRQEDATQNLTKSQRGLTRGLRKVNTVLKASIIGAVVAALASLFALFTKNQQGADQLERTLARLNGFLSVLIGSLIDAGKGFLLFGKAIQTFFSNPLTNSIKATKEAAEGFNVITASFDNFGDRVSKQADAFEAVAKAEQDLRIESRKLEKQIAATNKAFEIQTAIADDATRSFKEREEAAERARITGAKAARLGVTLAQEELDIINKRVDAAQKEGQVNNALLDEQKDGIVKLIEAEKELASVQLDNEKQRRELIQDRLERDLDILIDGFDNQKTINERIIADEQRVLEERGKVFERTTKLFDDSFEKQVETIQKFTDVQIDANALVAEDDAVVLNEKIRQLGLSEIIEGRILEVVRDRRTAIQDLAEAERDLSLAFEERANRRRDAINASFEFDLQQATLEKELDLELARNFEFNLKSRTDALEQFFIAKRNELVFDYEIQRQLIEREIKDEVEKNAKLELLEKQHQERIKQIDGESRKARQEEISKFISDVSNRFQETSAIASEFSNVLIDNNIAKREEQLAVIEEQEQKELEVAGDNTEARAAIEENFAKKKEAIERKIIQQKRKQAVIDKALTITGIVLNTAQAISKTIANLGLPIGLPFVIAAGALGAAQIATVAAQPIPQFEKGGITPGGVIEAGEKGAEIGVTKEGKVKIFDKHAYYDEPAGTRIMDHITSKRDYPELVKGKTDYSNELRGAIKAQTEKETIIHRISKAQPIDYDRIGKVIASKLPPSTLINFDDKGNYRTSIKFSNGTKSELSNQSGSVNKGIAEEIGKIKEMLNRNNIK